MKRTLVLAAAMLAALGPATTGSTDASQVERSPKHPGILLAHDVPAQKPSEYVTHPELDELATTFAMRPYSIHCPTLEAWEADPNADRAWGYTYLFWDFAVLDPMLCDAALDVAGKDAGSVPSPDWARALAVSVIVHEGYHGRLWHGRANEALVECKAVRHWTVAMRMLGVGEAAIAELNGWALALHWRLVRLNDLYYAPACGVPNPW